MTLRCWEDGPRVAPKELRDEEATLPTGGGGSIQMLANTTNPSLEFAGGLVRSGRYLLSLTTQFASPPVGRLFKMTTSSLTANFLYGHMS